MNSTYNPSHNEFEQTHNHIHRHIVCWKSTIAGFVVAITTFTGLIALAIAFGGIGLSDGATLQHAGIFTGISLLVATVLAVFVGSYFSVRVARFKVDIVGCFQGLVLGSLVCLFMVWGTVATVGMVGKAAAQVTGAAAVTAASGAGMAAQNQTVQEMIEDGMGDMKLKSESSVVIRGVASRLMRGDQEGAKNYLAAQAGITPDEANTRIAALKQKADEYMVKTREATATAMKTAGWSLFLMIALSAIASVLGGLLGTMVNSRRTLDVPDNAFVPARREKAFTEKQPAR